MKYTCLFLGMLSVFSFSNVASAQYAAQMDGVYLATIKAVSDYKINDEETLKSVNELRNDEKFNAKLKEMLSELNNDRTKTGKNRRVYEVLKKAGKEIYEILK